MDMTLQEVVLPVADADRSKNFYLASGFREQADFVVGDDFRVVQLTPPGSECSIVFGRGITWAAPGSVQGLPFVVSDVEAARAELVGRGVKVSVVCHDASEVARHAGYECRAAGPDPKGHNHSSFASFRDPDGNGWLLQEAMTPAVGR